MKGEETRMAVHDGELKPTLSVSVPSDQRDAFYTGLAELKRHDKRIFVSASTLIVEALLAAAERLREQERTQAAIAESPGPEDTETAKERASA